jgi:hypothetical protein
MVNSCGSTLIKGSTLLANQLLRDSQSPSVRAHAPQGWKGMAGKKMARAWQEDGKMMAR